MANEMISAGAVCKAADLYRSLPAANLLRGLTGYGLVVDNEDSEVIAPVANAKGIWKPMYFAISGGEQRGRKILTAAQIQAAVEEFKANALWAVLRTTSGRGLRLDNASGMVKLVDGRGAETPVAFEVTHYGGSSIVPKLSVTLGNLGIADIEWHSGFSYNSPDGKRVRVGEPLMLARFLVPDDFASDESLARVWEDIVREANRAMLLYTDGTLPKVYGGGQRGNVRAILSQELTTLVPGVVLDQNPEFYYRVRNDKVAEVQKTVGEIDFTDDAAFAGALDAFRKECMRVYTLYCQPLSENQRKLLGRPGGEIHGMVTTPKLAWQGQREGNGVIAFHPNAPRRENAVFPEEWWNPPKGKEHRVFCVRKGRGFTGYPAPAVYIERFAQKNDETAVRQVIRVEYDGSEKIIRDAEEIPLRKTEKWVEGTGWSARLEEMDGEWWIIQTLTSYLQFYADRVVEDYAEDVNGKRVTKIESRFVGSETYGTEHRFRPASVQVEPRGYQGRAAGSEEWSRLDQTKNLWGYALKAKGADLDGKAVEVSAQIGKNEHDHPTLRWEEIPPEFQEEYLARMDREWPVCACGRERYQSAAHERCNKCRNYRDCARCGKEHHFGEKAIAEADYIGVGLHCHNCSQWVVVAEALDRSFGYEHRMLLATEAERLLAGTITEGEEQAREFLKAAISAKVADEYAQSRKLANSNISSRSLALAVAKSDGYWMSELRRDELERIAAIADAPREAALVLVGIVLDAQVRAYVRQNTVPVPKLGRDVTGSLTAHLENGEPVLARFVLESDELIAHVEQAVNGCESALADLNALRPVSENDPRAKAVATAKALLAKGEFAKAKESADAAKHDIVQRIALINSGEILPEVRIPAPSRGRIHRTVFVIAPDGDIIEGERDSDKAHVYGDLPTSVVILVHNHDDYGYRRTEQWEVRHLPQTVTDAQRATVRRVEEETRSYFRGPGIGWDLRHAGTVVFSTAYHRDFVGEEANWNDEMLRNLPIDVTKWEQSVGEDGNVIVGPAPYRTAESKAVREAEDRALEARGELMSVEVSQEEVQEAYTLAEEEWLARSEAADGTWPIKDETVFMVSRFVRETREGKAEDLVCGPFFDHKSGTLVKLVLDPYSGASQRINERSRDVLVRVRPRSSSQVHLFETFLRPQDGGPKQKTFGYFVVPVRGPQDFVQEIAEAEEKHQAAEQALASAKAAAERKAAEERRKQAERDETTAYKSLIPEEESFNPLAEALRRAGLSK